MTDMNTNELAAKLLKDVEFLFRPPQVKIVDPYDLNKTLEIESVRVTADGATVLIETKI